ncbi:MAG: HemK2/MTQ2 family protein methyltransferase [Nanoarchaeota archaeon]
MYNPKEDSFFLSEHLAKYLKNKSKNIKILDMGTGSGIQAETCLKSGFKNILCADIDETAVRNAGKKFKSVKSDLFSNINGKFDLIIFNPPYLPENKYDREKDTAGGKKGDETILHFLEQAENHLAENGSIIILLSSLTPRKRINKLLRKYKKTKLAEKNIFFEKLEVWSITSA